MQLVMLRLPDDDGASFASQRNRLLRESFAMRTVSAFMKRRISRKTPTLSSRDELALSEVAALQTWEEGNEENRTCIGRSGPQSVGGLGFGR